ncbi:OmpA family protein [Maritimibacter sp. UBA3975]|uniref:OmpA family protein n=1 Tax=Maritimibacter sp. UBA3975 TaxID=1946833 RepID=UPI0025BE4A0C|nr:OmpA family protein [Maritimibacter sp. UBA3975]|tara:strand:+ start:27278 stop:28723 length:1446 start_codon:yes stop_codon:yes gene_type:complete
MRIILGPVVLVAGIAGLAWWGADNEAQTIESEVRASAEGVVTGAIHPMNVTVSGRDITLTGTADTEDELTDIVTSLDRVEGRRVVRADGVDVLPVAAPYETALAKGTDGSLAMTGTAPSAAQAEVAAAGGALGAMELPLASGAPEGWSDIVTAGAGALEPLNEGSFALTGGKVILSGKAQTPDEAKAATTAISDLPDGIDPVTAIDVIDPGVVAFELTFDAGEGLSVFGTVPETLQPTDMAEALGFDEISGETNETFGLAPDLEDRLSALPPMLPDFESLTLTYADGNLSATGVAAPGLDPGYVEGRLGEALGEGAEIAVTAGRAPEDWITRTNRATQQGQVASAGFWVPDYDFEITKQACNDAAAKVQAGRQIAFVTGSAELDRASMSIINDMAGLLLHCTDKVGMRVTIGGHTDSQGDDNENYRLSVERAKAVRDALVERGVPPGRMQAIGFGETEPIADNETEDGRAANRRTTFEWPQ